MDKQITGVMIYYYAVCKRKLWYFYHEVSMEQGNDNVLIGKIIDEETYMRDEKHINIDNVINIDFIRSRKVLHEIKKSNKIEEASILQVKYYLYYLKMRGVEVTAKLDYPMLKQCVEIVLNDSDIQDIEAILLEIEGIVKQVNPPSSDRKSICKKCAYYDLCYI